MHWYKQSGEPLYEVIGSNKKRRPTTLRDARKLNLVPSVTTILQVPAKPALDVWKQNQVLEAILRSDYDIKDLTPVGIDSWKKDILYQATQISRESANKGTQIHNAIEQWLLTGDCKAEYQAFVKPIAEVIKVLVPDLKDAKSEQSFAHRLGFGGKCDLSSPNIILDFKTKDKESLVDVKGYDEHCMQLSAYREGFDLSKARCYNLFISTSVPGELKLIEWAEEDMVRGWDMFKCLLAYWKLQNNFYVG